MTVKEEVEAPHKTCHRCGGRFLYLSVIDDKVKCPRCDFDNRYSRERKYAAQDEKHFCGRERS